MVNVGQKWLFYVMKDKTGVYLHPAENNPKPLRVQNKQSIAEYMFLAVVVQPRKICNGVWFDGEISVWPVVDVEEGHKKKYGENSNHETIHTEQGEGQGAHDQGGHPCNQGKRAKTTRGTRCFVRQNSAKSHAGRGVTEAILGVDRDTTMETKPANPSDLNVNDVSFSNYVQQLEEDVGVTNWREADGGHHEGLRCLPPGDTGTSPAEPFCSVWRSRGVHR
ncbi:unnamed protein product [Discosporangium mesarthrocarpum]